MEFLRFIFSSFWVWLGFIILVSMAGSGVIELVRACRRDRKVSGCRTGQQWRMEIEGASAKDARTAFASAVYEQEKETGQEQRRERILVDAVQTWGANAQALMMIEEMSELTQAICKLFRADSKNYAAVNDNVLEEMADVQIMLDQMKIMFGAVDPVMRAKLERLEGRLEAAHMKSGPAVTVPDGEERENDQQ